MESAYRNFAVCASNGRKALVAFLKFLIFLAIFLHPVNCVNVEETFLKIPALGRTSHLGSFYDARTDSFNGLNIFKSNLPADLITTTQTARTNNQAKKIRKESDKFGLFGVDLDTAASIQTGIVQPEGAASVLREDVTSKKGVSGIFLQTFQTAVQTLPIFQEELEKYFNTDPQLYTHATHVVTGISWGGSISVIFSDNPSSKRSSIQSSNILNQEFKKLKKTSENIGSQPSSFEMHLTSDVSLQNALPATLREVRGQINHVEDSIKVVNSGLGIPLKFTLTPISVFKKYLNVTIATDTKAHKVDESVLRRYLNVIDDISKIEKVLMNIKENSNCVSNELRGEMEQLLSNLNAAEQTFKIEFKKGIVEVKSGAVNNSALLEVLQNYERQDFNPKIVRSCLNRNVQGLQKVDFCSQLNEEYPDIEYFGSAPNLISKIYQNHNKPTYVLFTKSEFKENEGVSYEDNLNIFLNLLYKPLNALFIVDCDFSYAQCKSINGTVIKQIRQGNYTFDDARLEIKITEMENKTEIVNCNKDAGVTGALCVSTMARTSEKSKTKTLNRNTIKPLESETSKKVVGGNTAHPNEFPFQALFLNNATEVHCGGTILDENFILTAAHCLYDYDEEEFESWTIVAGDHDRSIDEGPEQLRQIRDLHIHEKYKPDFDVNDVAIVKLDRPLNFSREVQPILLPDTDYEATGKAVVTGWGRVRFGGSNPLVLQKVTVPIVDRADCVKAYEEAQVFVSIKMICAGELGVGGVDACQGDSGGPLSIKLDNGSSLLVGVVSNGIGCAQPEYPGIYMQVSKYVEWISDTLNNFKDNVTDNCSQQKLCKNGGTCVDRINSYSCTCAAEYEGQDCAAVKNNCEPNNPCLNGGTCVRGINSYSCDCTDGFTGNECQDAKECRYLGRCNSPPAVGSCGRCRDGFIKDPKDDTRCKFASSNASLIISSWEDIRMISLDGQNTTQMIQNGAYFYGTDFKFRNNTIFWFSGSDNKIYTALINGEDAKKSIFHDSTSSVYGVAVDWIYQHLYWVDDKRQRICVSNFDGTMKKVLINDDLVWPTSIALNPLNGWMYWSDRNKNRIERAGLDGSRREVFLSANVKEPFGLVIDFVESRLYWSQGQDPSSIWSSDFDGSGPKLIFTPNTFQLFSSMFWKVAMLAKYVYFIEDRSNTIYRVNKCNGKELEMVHKSESYLKDIKIYDATVQPEGENLCLKRIGRCSHFCFPVPVPSPGNGSAPTTTCGCPEGLSLLTDQQNCD